MTDREPEPYFLRMVREAERRRRETPDELDRLVARAAFTGEAVLHFVGLTPPIDRRELN